MNTIIITKIIIGMLWLLSRNKEQLQTIKNNFLTFYKRAGKIVLAAIIGFVGLYLTSLCVEKYFELLLLTALLHAGAIYSLKKRQRE